MRFIAIQRRIVRLQQKIAVENTMMKDTVCNKHKKERVSQAYLGASTVFFIHW